MKPFKNIMIVDDDEVSNYIFSKLITISGFAKNLIPFQKAGDALNFLRQKDLKRDELPEVLFLDLMLYDMSGWDFIDQYNSLNPEIRENIYLIILTTSIFDQDKEKALSYPGVNKFLQKPITVDALNEIREEIKKKTKPAGEFNFWL